MKHKNEPSYDLEKAKLLAGKGRVILTKKGTAWLRAHGYSPSKALSFIASLEGGEFVESLPPARDGGAWADVYRCRYCDDEIEGEFYVKFPIDEVGVILVILSSKEWGYAW